MHSYAIYPLKIAEFQMMESSTILYMQDYGVKVKGPVIAYLVRGDGLNILVDTGCSGPDWAEKHHHPIVQTEDMTILRQLEKHGLGPGDITCIVNTHLHWDHCWNNDLFPGKKIHVQRRELEFARRPLPPQYLAYENEALGLEPPFKKSLGQYEAADGDTNLYPGIDLVALPGHTPGFQGVAVETEKGRYLIASDALGWFRNWEGDGVAPHIPPGIHVTLRDCYATFDKMERICDYVLPGHDPRVFDHAVYPHGGEK